MFGVDASDKMIYEIATNKDNGVKLPVKKEYLFFNAQIFFQFILVSSFGNSGPFLGVHSTMGMKIDGGVNSLNLLSNNKDHY